MKDNFIQEIRFAGYNEPWKQRKLKEIADFSKGNGYSKSDLTHKGDPIILYGRLYTKYETLIQSVDTFTLKKEKSVMSRGHEVIVPSSGETSEDISRAAVVQEPGIILGGDLNIIRPTNEIDSIFLALSISNGKQRKELIKRAQGKSIVHLHNSDLKEVDLLFPQKDEQTKISEFFTQLDETISLQQQELNTLKQTKQGFLQKMFPKKGKFVPEFRFPGFADDWKWPKFEKFISKAGKKNTINKNYPAYSVSNKVGLVSQTEQFDGSRLDGLDKTSYKIVNPKEFVYNPSRINVGSIAFNYLNEVVIVSSLYVVIKMSEELDNNFILQYIKSGIFISEVKKNTEGSVREYLFFENFKNLKFPYTSNKDEQIQIGNFFKHLDEVITLQEQELDALKQTKKAFLQKMFV